MGFYLNLGNKGFWESARSKIYVDKTGLIACTNGLINTEEKFVCVCRPRRFGKSMTLEMLAAYYSCGCDSADLFKGCSVETGTLGSGDYCQLLWCNVAVVLAFGKYN